MIRILFYTVIAVLLLSFFGISIQGVIESPQGQENIAYVTNLFMSLLRFIWNFIAPAIEWIIRIVT